MCTIVDDNGLFEWYERVLSRGLYFRDNGARRIDIILCSIEAKNTGQWHVSTTSRVTVKVPCGGNAIGDFGSG